MWFCRLLKLGLKIIDAGRRLTQVNHKLGEPGNRLGTPMDHMNHTPRLWTKNVHNYTLPVAQICIFKTSSCSRENTEQDTTMHHVEEAACRTKTFWLLLEALSRGNVWTCKSSMPRGNFAPTQVCQRTKTTKFPTVLNGWMNAWFAACLFVWT